jgi:predicted esterase
MAAGAQSLWNRFFANRPETDRFVVVIPYVNDGDLITDTGRMLVILDEMLWCTRANPQAVHLAGTSNGGLAAFAIMTAHPEYFATLLGAPGAFPVPDPSKVQREVWAERFAGRAVFNGVGAADAAWRAEVMATHNALAAAGVESVFVEFARQGHVTDATFDPSPFFEFWGRH